MCIEPLQMNSLQFRRNFIDLVEIYKYMNSMYKTPASKSLATITRHQDDKLSKQSNQLSLSHQDDCKTRIDVKERTT